MSDLAKLELLRGSLDHCVKCTICETACPVSDASPLFPGPKYAGPQGAPGVHEARGQPAGALPQRDRGEIGDSRPDAPASRAAERETADPGAPTSEARTDLPWSAGSTARSVEPVVRHGAGKVIQLATGVRWERLAPPTPQDVDFLEVAYQPGSESCPPDSLMRHSGHEYGHIISGRMGVTVGFETYELGPGDSVAFDSTMPHRLFAIGEETVEAIWVVVGRRGDARLGHGP